MKVFRANQTTKDKENEREEARVRMSNKRAEKLLRKKMKKG